MHAELPTLSFLAIFLLVLILPGQLKSNTVPAVSVICWLFVCNIIHGVNSIVWAGHVDVRAPVWCDIASKILLGAMVALPGAFFCISRRLELLTSRHQHAQKYTKYKTHLEVLMCIVMPVVYMALHAIVQNHRFTIVEDLGCQAAVHRSLTGLVLVWLPPLVISLLALLYNISALINIGKSRYNSVAYFPSAPEMSFSLFARRLAYATIGMLYTAVVYVIVTSWSANDMEPWTSVSQVHANFSQVETVQHGTAVATGSELIWWTIPIWSLLLCALSAVGEETRKGYRTILTWLSHRTGKDFLPTHTKQVSSTQPPVYVLRSGWDEALDARPETTKKLTLSKSTSTLSSSAPSTSPAPDDAFTQSTLTYLDSDTARQLHLPSPPPFSHYRTDGAGSPTSPASPTETTSSDNMLIPKVPASVAESPRSSILSTSAWPQPPPSPLLAHPYAGGNAQPARADSPILAGVESRGDVPFTGPGMLAIPLPNPMPAPKSKRKTSTGSARSRAQGSVRAGRSKGSGAEDVFRMTVVKETVVDEV